ncbi:MAG: PorP/SprF family type IX secretion system membrane protein [Bacteroidales bacterium]
MIRLLTSFFLMIMTACLLQGQYVAGFAAGNGKNPSFAGIEGDGSLRLTYQSFFPGGGYDLNSYHLSYDVFMEPLHGGVGVAVSSDHSGGLLSDSRIRLSWSYHLRATRELYIFAGMNVGLIHRNFNSSRLVFPDQIDPLNGVIFTGGETVNYPSSLFYDMGAGFTLLYRTSFFSFDASHLFRPDLSRSGVDGADLPRIFTFQAFSRQNLGSDELNLVPYAELVAGGRDFSLAAGSVLEYNSLGFSMLWLRSAVGNSIQTSCSMKIERLTVNYAFRFRAGASEAGVPFGLMHQAGIRLSLNIVDKRYVVKAINLPEL